MATRRTSIKIVPHFMRLHEWIALEEGHFQAEGREPALQTDLMHAVSLHDRAPYKQRPQDQPFVEGLEVANSACHWGSVCNAAAGMGHCYDTQRFGLGELLVFEPSPEEEYERTVAFARKWGLDTEIRETRYEQLIAPLG